MKPKFFIFYAILLLLNTNVLANKKAPWVGYDFNNKPCTFDGQTYGPFDYTNKWHRKENLPIVEKFHFQHPRGIGVKVTDLQYTLNSFPNHHRALAATIRNRLKNKKSGKTPPECYLQKAIAFTPNDGTVYALLGMYTHRLKMAEEAEAAYRKSIKLQPNSSETHYNLGLLLAQQKRFEEALVEAKAAYKLGYPLPGLKRKLLAAGYNL